MTCIWLAISSAISSRVSLSMVAHRSSASRTCGKERQSVEDRAATGGEAEVEGTHSDSQVLDDVKEVLDQRVRLVVVRLVLLVQVVRDVLDRRRSGDRLPLGLCQGTMRDRRVSKCSDEGDGRREGANPR